MHHLEILDRASHFKDEMNQLRDASKVIRKYGTMGKNGKSATLGSRFCLSITA